MLLYAILALTKSTARRSWFLYSSLSLILVSSGRYGGVGEDESFSSSDFC